MLELGLLGPVRAVRAGRELPLGGPRQRAVLALLLVEAGRVVPSERLIEEVWRGGPPPGAAVTLRSYVSRLRGRLAPDATLVARGGGYVLTLGLGRVDAVEFERLAGAGRAALAAGEAAAAASRFGEALGLWRGEALADVYEVEWLALEAARLEELRLAALEGRIEADLALGRQVEVTGELQRLVAEYPLRERLWWLLVLALYRAGRQAEALAAYRRARAMLASELGLEPGEELRRLEEAVLRQEVPPAPPLARHNLPAPLTSFVGRERDLAALGRLVSEARLITLTGVGGAGKTRLAVELAASAAGRFADGAWLADLAGVTGSGLVAAQVMEALGVRQAGDVPVLEALGYRLRSAELLLVVDNCEHLLDACAELASELLRGSPGLRVLATSREPLGVAGEVIYPVRPLALPPEEADAQAVAAAPAVRLFVDRGTAARGGAAGVVPVAVAGRICRALDGLPLAIELAAARMGTLSAGEIEAHLADRFAFLAYRRPAADPRHQALQAAMDWSYDLLPQHERRVLGELSVFAGSFALAQVAEVCSGGDQAAALEVVDQLASKSLVATEPADGGTRYRLLETIRQYAAGRLAEAGEVNAGQVRRRHALAFLALAERERGLAALARDHDNFRAALEWSLAQGDQAGPRLAHALGDSWLARGLLQEARDWLELALAQRPADQRLHAGLLRLLGTVLKVAGDLERAGAALAEGLHVAEAAGLPAMGARIRILLAEIRAEQGGSSAEVLEECAAATAILDAEGDLAGLAEAWILAGVARYWLGDTAACHEALERAAAYARQSGNRYAQRQASLWLAISFALLPVPADVAISRVEQLLSAAEGEPRADSDILMWLAVLYGYAGRFADARRASARSQQMLTETGEKVQGALCAALVAGQIELIAGDPAAAEHHIRDGYQALRAMGERGYLSTVTGLLAEAVYAQGRLGEADRLTEETRAIAAPDDIEPQARWRATRAKLLARRDQFPAARELADEAAALIAPTSWTVMQAEMLEASAEVSRLAGAPAEAAASLRKALEIYQDRRAVPLAERTRAALASLTAERGGKPA
jgi:predicted ATPase/DNA-binding SARP family transcriptional activator